MTNRVSAAEVDRLWMCITAIAVANDMPHIIITNRKYIPANEQAADVAV